jgi:hypothetical protein
MPLAWEYRGGEGKIFALITARGDHTRVNEYIGLADYVIQGQFGKV